MFKAIHGYTYLVIAALIVFGGIYFYGKQQGRISEETKQAIAEVKASLAAIQKDKDTVKTPAQIAVTVPKYTPDVKPVLIVPGGVPTNVSDVGGNIPSISLPDAPSAIPAGSLVILKDDVPAYWKSVTDCATDRVNLTGCQAELKAEKAKHGWKSKLIWMGVGAAAGYVAAKH